MSVSKYYENDCRPFVQRNKTVLASSTNILRKFFTFYISKINKLRVKRKLFALLISFDLTVI